MRDREGDRAREETEVGATRPGGGSGQEKRPNGVTKAVHLALLELTSHEFPQSLPLPRKQPVPLEVVPAPITVRGMSASGTACAVS